MGTSIGEELSVDLTTRGLLVYIEKKGHGGSSPGVVLGKSSQLGKEFLVVDHYGSNFRAVTYVDIESIASISLLGPDLFNKLVMHQSAERKDWNDRMEELVLKSVGKTEGGIIIPQGNGDYELLKNDINREGI